MTENNQEAKIKDVLPIETPKMELSTLITEEDPEIALSRLEKIADLAPRYKAALQKILISLTFPADWEIFGEGHKAKACLSCHGAMRVGSKFPYQIFETQSRKEEWIDAIGKAYRYVFSCKAALGGRVISAQGIYSTRDEFLGKAHQKWKAIEDINEADISNGAHNIMLGNAIKALLGIKNIPADEYKKLMGQTGQDDSKTGAHTYKQGQQGGGTKDYITEPQQKRLFAICKQNNVTEEMLKKYMFVEYALESTKQITKDIYEKIVNWAEQGGNIPPQREPGEGQ